MSHGHINANSLRISDDYTFTLSDFPISTVTNELAKMSVEEQNEAKIHIRGVNKNTASDDFKNKLGSLIESMKEMDE